MMDNRIKQYHEIVSECRRFARNEICPLSLENDLNPDPEWLRNIWIKSHALDIPGLMLPEKFNGAGFPALCGAYVVDVLAMECAGVASMVAHHFAACMPSGQIDLKNSEFLKKLWNSNNSNILPMATAIFPDDFNNRSISIKKDATGWILNGKTSLTANADLAEIYCVFLFENESDKHVFCVMVNSQHEGVRFGNKAALNGLNVICFQELIFDHLKIHDHLVVASGENGKILFDRFINDYYGFVAAMAMGTARTAYAKALAYAKERYQFGKKIIFHQEIQRMLGAMKMKIDMGTAGYVQVFIPEKINLPGFSGDGRSAKAYCSQAALEIVQDAIQIHGGYGYMHEYGLEKIMRDVKILQLLGGRNPYHHIQVIAEEL
jgi:butyryl-CoA dehydrogenase